MRPHRPRYLRACSATLAILLAAPALAQPEPPADADLRAYLAGNGMLARGMNELAAKEYESFLTEHADHERAPHARYGLGVALFRQNRFADAATQLRGLVDLKGFEFGAEAGYLQAQCAIAADTPADAVAPLQRVLKQHADHALADDAASLLAESRYRAGEFEPAIAAAADLERRWADSPARDRAEYFAALAEIKTGAERKAAERLAKLAERWPKSPLAGQASLLSAQCAHRSGDPEAARRHYQSIIAANDAAQTPDALLGLASLEHAAGNLPAARQALDTVLSEHSKSAQAPAALLQRGRVLLDQNEPDTARADFEQYAKSKEADKTQGAYWIAKCHLRAGKAKAAVKLLKGALESDPDSELAPAVMYDLAVAQAQAGDDAEAVATLEAFRASHADHALAPDATEALASLQHRRAEYAASGALCEEFRQRFKDHAALPRIDLLAAENAFLAGDLPAAAKAYEKYLRAPADETGASLARFRLGCVHFRQEEHAKAAPFLEAAAAEAGENATFRPALLYLGDIAFQQEDWQRAAEWMRRYAESDAAAPGADDALLKRAIALHRLGQPQEAVDTLERLLREHPKSERGAVATFELARSLLALERTDEARQHLDRLARSDDAALAAMAQNQLASLAIEAGDLDAAARLYSASAERNDARSSADALHGLGSVLLSRGKHEEAVAAFDRLLSEHADHPRAAEARAQRALARARLTPDEEALNGLASAIREEGLTPDLRDALRYEQTVCLRKLERPEEAAQQLSRLATNAAQPSLRIHAALDLARAQMQAEEFEQAAATLEAARPLLDQPGVTPELKEHMGYQLAAVAFRRERWKEASDAFAAFLEKHESSQLAPSASLLAAESLVHLNQHARAIERLKAALEGELADADRQTASLRLGECLAVLQDWPGSAKVFSDFLERFTSSELWFQARFGKGWALENQGKHDEAIAEYTKVTARHQGPTAARAQFQIGECLFAQGKHDEAVRELLKVDILYAYPEWSAAALYEAGRCFEALNKPEEATAHYKQVREKHPQTQWAKLAAQRLTVLSSTSR
jgi:TolA-binding protein